jgi:hypothetical protein
MVPVWFICLRKQRLLRCLHWSGHAQSNKIQINTLSPFHLNTQPSPLILSLCFPLVSPLATACFLPHVAVHRLPILQADITLFSFSFSFAPAAASGTNVAFARLCEWPLMVESDFGTVPIFAMLIVMVLHFDTLVCLLDAKLKVAVDADYGSVEAHACNVESCRFICFWYVGVMRQQGQYGPGIYSGSNCTYSGDRQRHSQAVSGTFFHTH